MNSVFLDDKFAFPGFHSQGACHIRILQEEGKKPTVVCSQLPHYHGTSVTNAFEIIASLLIDNHWSAKENKFTLKARSADHETPTFVAQFITFISKLFIRELEPSNWAATFDKLTWIEHYPLGTGISSTRATFMLVTLPDGASPSWSQTLTPIQLEAVTGYPSKYFDDIEVKLSAEQRGFE